jgi:predicted methyltransferase
MRSDKMKSHKMLLVAFILIGVCAPRPQSATANQEQDQADRVANTPITTGKTLCGSSKGLAEWREIRAHPPSSYTKSRQEGSDPRLAEWAKLPPPDVEKMRPFLGAWESSRKSGGLVGSVTTFEVRGGVVRARHRVTPSGGEPFQLEVQFIRVLDGQTLQWGLRNPSMGVVLQTAKLVDENTLQGTSEPVGIPHAPPPSTFTLKRRVGDKKPAPKSIDEAAVRALSQASDRGRKRDEWQRPAEVIDALAVRPGQRVADIGSGSGYFTFRLAAAVSAQGKVYAVDIDEEAINRVRQRKEREKLEQVEPILGEGDDPRLPHGLDAVLIVDTYHEFREYDRMMGAVFRALKPGGRLVVIDGEAPAARPRTEYHRLHGIPAELVREEVARHGFVFKESRPGFYDPEYGKKMYFLIFERPLPDSSPGSDKK